MSIRNPLPGVERRRALKSLAIAPFGACLSLFLLASVASAEIPPPPLTAKLTQLKALEEGFGARLTYLPNGTLAVADGYEIGFFKGLDRVGSIKASFHTSQGELQVASNGSTLLAGTLRIPKKGDDYQDPFLVDSGIFKRATRHGGYEVHSTSWSPDGRLAVIGLFYRPGRCKNCKGCETPYKGPKKLVVLVDGRVGVPLARLEGDEDGPFALSNDLILVSDGTKVRAWKRKDLFPKGLPETGATKRPLSISEVTRMDVPASALIEKDALGWSRIRFSPDGKLLAAVSLQGDVVLKDTKTLETVYAWKGHKDAATALAFHPSLPILATAGADSRLKLWRFDWGPARMIEVKLEPTQFDNPRPEDLVFSPDGTTLVLARYSIVRKLIFFRLEAE